MRKNYLGLWLILVVAFAVFAVASAFDEIKIGPWQLKSSQIAHTLTRNPNEKPAAQAAAGAATRAATAKPKHQAQLDTASKTILFIGDSMLDGLSPRLAHYAKQNGHTLYSVIWYSSTSEAWGKSGKLASYIARLHPDYIFICLGSNELMVPNIIEKRDKYVKQMVKEIGNIPFVWIGPPNWKKDTGINDMIASNVPAGSYFMSNGMKFERKRDGAHPTHASAEKWMDSIARWMPTHAAHPIKMVAPLKKEGRAARVFIHQPSEIQ